MPLIGKTMTNPTQNPITNPYVVVRNPGMENEAIVGEFPTWAKACHFMRDEPDTDMMKRLADGSLTTDF